MRVDVGAVRSSILALVRQNKINSLIYSLFVPLLVGIWSNFYAPLTEVNPLLFWVPVTGFVIFALAAAYFTYDLKLAPEVFIELQDLDNQARTLSEDVKLLSEIQEQCLGWSNVVREHIRVSEGDAEAFQEIAAEICRVLVESRDTLLRIEPNELWNFTLYVHSDADGHLHPIWREKHPRHPSSGQTRSWAPGQGHVGIAFAQCEPKICPDATAPGVWEVFSAANEKEYDRSAYISFASEPIGPTGVDGEPYGVLVATSNRKGRFNVGTALALRHAASALATIIDLRYNRSVLSQVCQNAAVRSPQ